MFSDEHKFKQFKGGNPRHNFLWAKSVSEVPGQEMERWGLTVDAWEDSARRARLSCPCMKALSTHPRIKTFEKVAAAGRASVVRRRIGRWEFQQDKATCHTAKSTTDWLEQHEVEVVEGWPTKGDDINPMEKLEPHRRET